MTWKDILHCNTGPVCSIVFFFQAEDGIRDRNVTGVQTCALPILYARDIEVHSAVSIVNPDQLLFTVQDDRDIGGELYVNKGRGYVEAEQHPVDRTMPVDVVRVDSIYNPVRRANFTVAETRVGQRT